MTNDKLKAMKARCAAATEEPWNMDAGGHINDKTEHRNIASTNSYRDTNYLNNAAFIAHARNRSISLMQAGRSVRADLKLYGEHKDYCGVRWTLESPKYKPCDCGLKTALEQE